jgi:MFS family permease
VIWNFLDVSAESYGKGFSGISKKDIVKGYQTGHTRFLPNGKLLSATVLGLFLESNLADYFGYRKLISGSLLLMNAFLFIPFFTQNIETFVAAELLQGIPWGKLF